MKVTLTFDLPEERDDLEYALNGIHYGVALESLDGWLRNLAKYEDKTFVTIEDVRARIREELEGRLIL